MAASRVKLYIGCSLTQAPAGFAEAVQELKSQLSRTYEVLDFLGLTKGTPTDVYHWDISRNIATCDLFVAICDHPAIGLGYELATAVEKYGKPVLAVAQADTRVTRIVMGIDHPGYSFERYKSLSDVPALIEHKLSSSGL